MALAAVHIISETMSKDNPTPLPTKEIAERLSDSTERKKSFARKSTSISLASFSSDSSVSSDPGKIAKVGNLRFLNDSDMPDGQSSILGKGAFAMVRLARRRPAQRSASIVSALSLASEHNIEEPENSSFLTTNSSEHNEVNKASGETDEEKLGTLVAVKIFEKSLLQKCRTIVRDSKNQMQVTTALENVEREIAVMKMIQHPNLVSLYEVIDTGTNRLYMVIEYLPLGEIMTNIRGTGNFKRRPARKGEEGLVQGVTPEGYFDERHAALYFVDLMHGLAHLHKNHIVHRDLKPENILLDSRGFAKISDFGVAHLFENEKKSAGRSSLDQTYLESPARISRRESEYALGMKSMSDMGQLTKTEGTWCFWSPEMCAENSLVFSGYACDIYAAGVCLFIFATGKLPFYTDLNVLALFDLIAEGNINYDDLKVSDQLKDLLKKVLAKDPATRAGVGDCLQHPFCKDARTQRLKELGEDVEKHEEVVIQAKDLQQAFSLTKQATLRNLAGRMSGGFLSFKNRFSLSQRSSMQSMSMSIDEKTEGTPVTKGANASRKRVNFPFPSQKTMSMDHEDEDGSSKNTRRKGLGKLFWRSTGQL